MTDRWVVRLSRGRRAESAAPLTRAQRLPRTATVEVDVVDPRSADAQAALARYFAELDVRFEAGFDAGDDSPATAALRAPGGVFLVLRSDSEPVGCGGVQRIGPATGEIKRMWIHPDWRSLGLGGRLLARLEAAARELGYTRVVLDTNATLIEAIAMYQRAGYEATQRYNDNPYAQRWFTKDLCEAPGRR